MARIWLPRGQAGVDTGLKLSTNMASLTDRIADFFGGRDTAADEGLRDLFISELKSIYYAEQQAVEALGRQAEASTSDEVRAAFVDHQQQSETQVDRLEEIFRILSIVTSDRPNHTIDGLVSDAGLAISDTESGSLTRDAALIIAAQKIEHLEIATYGSLLTLARVLGFDQSAELLAITLEEEKAMDHKLTQLAESFVNQQAKEEETPGSHHASRSPQHSADADVTLGGPLGV